MRAGWIAPQDTLRRTLLLWMAWPSATLAKHAGYVIREGIAALITHKVLRLSNNKKSGLLSFPGKQPAPTILCDFTRDLGAGGRSRFVTTAIDGYRKSARFPWLRVRVECYRQMIWLVTNSNNRRTERRRASRPRATNWFSGLCRAFLSLLSDSLTLKSLFLRSSLSFTGKREPSFIKPEDCFCQ